LNLKGYFLIGPEDHFQLINFAFECTRDTAQQQCELRKKLAAKHRLNREAYTEAKTEFIESVVHNAA